MNSKFTQPKLRLLIFIILYKNLIILGNEVQKNVLNTINFVILFELYCYIYINLIINRVIIE